MPPVWSGSHRAAGRGGADLIDVACDPALVRLAIEASGGVPVCVSSVEPEQFPAAVDAGALMVEIGNYDAFYPQGRIFDAAEVLELTRRTRQLLPNVALSVTVPHVLPMDEQEQLAIDLVAAGADLIQTEGGTSAKPFSAGHLGLIEKAAPTLAAAHSISRAVDVPVLCASGPVGGHAADGHRCRCGRGGRWFSSEPPAGRAGDGGRCSWSA